ncbi:MAG TPA: hypothetical protein VHM48_10990, partial [Candidatus Limnocylindrales bacterium]|nr:hypothetical protein [Candidatus Limnocylindrales bacterium]
MTEPREPASDVTEPIAIPPDGADASAVAPGAMPEADTDAARAEAEAAAMAADELGGEDEPDGAEDDDEPAEDEAEGDEDEEADEPADDEGIGDESAAGAAAALASGSVPGRVRVGRATKPTKVVTPATIIDPSIKVTDQASKIFVIGTVLVFVLIFAYGALLGVGGSFTPYVAPTPSPTPIATPTPRATRTARPRTTARATASGWRSASATV